MLGTTSLSWEATEETAVRVTDHTTALLPLLLHSSRGRNMSSKARLKLQLQHLLPVILTSLNLSFFTCTVGITMLPLLGCSRIQGVKYKRNLTVVGRKMPPKDFQTPILGIFKYVPLHGRRDFVNVTKFSDLNIGRLSGPNLINWVLKSRRGSRRVSHRTVAEGEAEETC